MYGPLLKTPSQGADSLVHALLSPVLEGEGGSYLSGTRHSTPSALARDEQAQERLWEQSLKLVGMEEFGEGVMK